VEEPPLWEWYHGVLDVLKGKSLEFMPGLVIARFYPGSASIMMNMPRDVIKTMCHIVLLEK